MKDFLRKNIYLIILLFLCAISLYFSVGHYANIMLDVGREVYYPQQILQGKVLYRDLFVIYGPFAYLFNALLYKLFGIKLSVMYISGIVSSMLLTIGCYLLSRKFLNGFLSFSITALTIATGVCASILQNFTFPYCWAILYGTVAFIYSVLLLTNYERDKKTINLYISTFLAGISITCKYEFAIYIFILFCYLIYICSKDLKKGLKAFAALLSVQIISFGILFTQGLKLSDLLIAFENIRTIAQTNTLKYFYQTVGAYFHPKLLPIIFYTFLKAFVSLGTLFCGVLLKNKNKYASAIVTISGLLISIWFLTDTKISTFTFLPILLIVTSIICYKKLQNNIPLLILVMAGISISIKSVFGMLLLSYASYYFFIVLIAFFSLLFKCIGKNFQTITGIYILMLASCILFIDSFSSKDLNSKISTEKGSISTFKDISTSTNELINFIKNNTEKNDKIVILPEGLIINFLTERQSDNYFNSMLPLYIESFGEKNIINHFEGNKPEYFVLSNEKMDNYGFKYICYDYALGLCSFIKENYDHIKTIDNGYRYLIFRKK